MTIEMYYNITAPTGIQSFFTTANELSGYMLTPALLLAMFFIIFIGVVMAGYSPMKAGLTGLFVMNIVGYMMVAFKMLTVGWMVLPTVALLMIAIGVMMEKTQ